MTVKEIFKQVFEKIEGEEKYFLLFAFLTPIIGYFLPATINSIIILVATLIFVGKIFKKENENFSFKRLIKIYILKYLFILFILLFFTIIIIVLTTMILDQINNAIAFIGIVYTVIIIFTIIISYFLVYVEMFYTLENKTFKKSILYSAVLAKSTFKELFKIGLIILLIQVPLSILLIYSSKFFGTTVLLNIVSFSSSLLALLVPYVIYLEFKKEDEKKEEVEKVVGNDE